MKKYSLLPIIMIALLFTACSSDVVTEQTSEGRIPICLNAIVDGAGATRGYTNTGLRNNTKVWVWADMINLSDSRVTEYFNGWELKATNTSGARLVLGDDSENKFFPATNVLNMYSMTGNFSGYAINSRNSLPVSPAFIYHTVNDNQTTEAGYYNSDLLFSQVLNQEPVLATDGVNLKFYHMLSRVRVVLIPGNGNTTNDNYNNDVLRTATVTLLNVETRVKFTPSKSLTMDELAEQSVRASMIEVAPKNPDDAADYEPRRDITINTGVVAYDEHNQVTDACFGDAIIVPQTVSAGEFIKVTLTDPGTELTYDTYFRFDSDFTFESGKQYRFLLTLDRIGNSFELKATIDDWNNLAGSSMWVEPAN